MHASSDTLGAFKDDIKNDVDSFVQLIYHKVLPIAIYFCAQR